MKIQIIEDMSKEVISPKKEDNKDIKKEYIPKEIPAFLHSFEDPNLMDDTDWSNYNEDLGFGEQNEEFWNQF